MSRLSELESLSCPDRLFQYGKGAYVKSRDSQWSILAESYRYNYIHCRLSDQLPNPPPLLNVFLTSAPVQLSSPILFRFNKRRESTWRTTEVHLSSELLTFSHYQTNLGVNYIRKEISVASPISTLPWVVFFWWNERINRIRKYMDSGKGAREPKLQNTHDVSSLLALVKIVAASQHKR